MRKTTEISFGGRSYNLTPAFAVIDVFEEMHGGLLQHLDDLVNGKAAIHARAELILGGLKAGHPEGNWELESVMEEMFKLGYWHEDLVTKETNFIQTLLYTPEQFVKKKEEEAAARTAMINEIMVNSSEEPLPQQP